MIKVFYSHRIEDLLLKLAEKLDCSNNSLEEILRPRRVIYPKIEHVQGIKEFLAQRLGIAANLQFENSHALILSLLREAELGDVSILHRAIYAGFLLEGVEKVDRHSRGVMVGEAFEIASLWSEYAMTREELLSDWRCGANKFHTSPAMHDREIAMAEKYRSLFNESELAKRDWMQISDLIGTESFLTFLEQRKPESFYIFDPLIESNVFQRFLRSLALHNDVYIFAFNPCLDLWDDIETRAFLDDEENELENLEGVIFKPTRCFPLERWGRAAQRLHISLLDLSDENVSVPEEQVKDSQSVLRRLQSAITALEQFGEAAPKRVTLKQELRLSSEDASLQCHVFETIEAEVLAIAETILQEMKNNPELRFEDFSILFPNQQKIHYEPVISFAFNQLNVIPFSDEVFHDSSRVAAFSAFVAFLDLCASNLTREAMLQWLTHPVIVPEDCADCAEKWIKWTHELGIFWGEGAETFGEQDYRQRAFHWEQGLERLFIGLYHDLDSFEGQNMEIPRINSDELPQLVNFLHFVRASIGEYKTVKKDHLTLQQWASSLSSFVDAYFHTSSICSEYDIQMLKRLFLDLRKLDLGNASVYGFETIHVIIKYLLNRVDYAQNKTNAGVGFQLLSPQLSYRAPYLFIIGLNEESFPNIHNEPLDIRSSLNNPGESSRLELDQLAFLKTLLNADKLLWLSCALEDSKNNSTKVSKIFEEFIAYYRPYLLPVHKSEQALQTQRFAPQSKREILKMIPEGREKKIETLSIFNQGQLTNQTPNLAVSFRLSSLSDFLKDPNRAYKRHVLNQRNFESLEEILEYTNEPFYNTDERTLIAIVEHAILNARDFTNESSNLDLELIISHYKSLIPLMRGKGRYPDSFFADLQLKNEKKTIESWLEKFYYICQNNHYNLKNEGFYKIFLGQCTRSPEEKYLDKITRNFLHYPSYSLTNGKFIINDALNIANHEALFCFFNKKYISKDYETLLPCFIQSLLLMILKGTEIRYTYCIFTDKFTVLRLDKLRNFDFDELDTLSFDSLLAEETLSKLTHATGMRNEDLLDYLSLLASELLGARHEYKLNFFDQNYVSTDECKVLEVFEKLNMDIQALLNNKEENTKFLSLQALSTGIPKHFIDDCLFQLEETAIKRYLLPLLLFTLSAEKQNESEAK